MPSPRAGLLDALSPRVVGGLLLAALVGADAVRGRFTIGPLDLWVGALALGWLVFGHGTGPARPGLGLRVMVALGLVTGWTEVLHFAVRKAAFGAILKLPTAFAWLVPVAELGLFAAVGLAFAGASLLWPRAFRPVMFVFYGAFLGAWSHLSIYRLHAAAELILAVGAAVAVTRPLAAWSEANLRRWSERGLVGLGALLLLAIAFGQGSRSAFAVADDRREPAVPGAPNVLLLVLDTVRADHLSCYGYERATTPQLDALAERSVLFERAFTPSPWTLPSHATIFTGLDAHRHGADWQAPLPEGIPTLAEILALQGYATGGFVGNIRYCAAEFGIARGFDHYEDYGFEPAVLAYCAAVGRSIMAAVGGQPFHTLVRNDATTVTDGFLGWLEQCPTDQPFFAFLNYYDAHQHCAPPPEFAGRFGPGAEYVEHWNARRREWLDAEMQGFVNDYDACIAYIDDEIGRLLRELAAQGRGEDTIVIVTADHGEQFGEHDLIGHGNSLYVPSLHAPLLLAMAGVPPVRLAEPVSLRDLPATILELVDANVALPGASLRGLWIPGEGAVPSTILGHVTGLDAPPWLPVSRGDVRSVMHRGWQLIELGDDTAELYDLSADWAQADNLVNAAAQQSRLKALRERLRESWGR
ncbi:MAG: sulfatase [Planctomycetota bacterium]